VFKRQAFFLIGAILLVNSCRKREAIDPRKLTESFTVMLHPYNPLISGSTPDIHIPVKPKCDSIPIEHHNIKLSVHPATKDESPQIQICGTRGNTGDSNSAVYPLNAGTQLKIDVSYYYGIKQVVLIVGGSSEIQPVATAYNSKGQIIERQVAELNQLVFFFDNDLDDLHDITLVSRNGNVIPRTILINEKIYR
jgi:hypothetical protein